MVRCDPTTTPVCLPSTTGIPTASGLTQDRVGDFNTVNLFFKYEVPGDSLLLSDLELTLNINNVFDTDPPIYRPIGNSISRLRQRLHPRPLDPVRCVEEVLITSLARQNSFWPGRHSLPFGPGHNRESYW